MLGEALRNARRNLPPREYTKSRRQKEMPASEAAALLVEASKKMGRPMEISRDMLYKFEQGKSSISTSLLEIAEAAYGLNKNTLTSLYYNDPSISGLDNGPTGSVLRSAQKFSARTQVPIWALTEGGSAVWEVKREMAEKHFVWSYLAEESEFVKIGTRSAGRLKASSLVCFRREETPMLGVYLLVESKVNPRQRAIRYLARDGDGQQLLSPHGEEPPLSLAEWRILGWAYAMAERQGESYPDWFISTRGITLV